MAEKRYYWIKLHTNFFEGEKIDFLMGQKDGANYIVLYEMLCMKTANTDGLLATTLGEMIIPYDIDKIVRDCKYFTKDTVMVALELYKQLGLIYANNNGVLQITGYTDIVGSEVSSAKRVREFRTRQKALQNPLHQPLHSRYIVTQDNRDKSIDTANIYNIQYNSKEKNNTPNGVSKKESSLSNDKSLSSRSLTLTDTNTEDNNTTIPNNSDGTQVHSNTPTIDKQSIICSNNETINESNITAYDTVLTSDINTNNGYSEIVSDVVDASEYTKEYSKKQFDKYVMELFDKTWAIYPRKVSKEQAKKTWVKKMRCCKTLAGVRNKAAKIYKMLMAHIKMWRTERGDDGDGARPLEYIPHFSSWLNNEIPDD